MTQRHWRGLFVLACALTLFLALRPAPAGLTLFAAQDKLEHAAAFAALALLGLRGWPGHPLRLGLALLLLGGAIEIAQGFTSDRQAELLDWLADAAGLALVLLPGHLQRRRPSSG